MCAYCVDCDHNAKYGNIQINCIHPPKYIVLSGKLQKKKYNYINVGVRLVSTQRLMYCIDTIT